MVPACQAIGTQLGARQRRRSPIIHRNPAQRTSSQESVATWGNRNRPVPGPHEGRRPDAARSRPAESTPSSTLGFQKDGHRYRCLLHGRLPQDHPQRIASASAEVRVMLPLTTSAVDKLCRSPLASPENKDCCPQKSVSRSGKRWSANCFLPVHDAWSNNGSP